MNYLKRISQVMLMGGVVLLTSCNENDDNKNNNPSDQKSSVKEVLESESKYSSMNNAVEESNNTEFFTNANANITLFAASNSAWDQVFADAGVSSMTELKNQMGEEDFSNLIMYHALNGRFEYSQFENGNEETNADAETQGKLTVLVENNNNSQVTLNGNDENGAAIVGNEGASAENGIVFEIDGALQSQSNYENMEENESNFDAALYVDVMTQAETDVKDSLKNQETTVLAANDANLKASLAAHLSSVMDVDDLSDLLAPPEKSQLFNSYGVQSLTDLLVQVKLEDILIVTNSTMVDILGEFEAEDKSEMMNELTFEGDQNFENMTGSSVTSKSGANFNVSSNSSGNIVLTDDDGNEFILEGKSATSANGSIYTISEVK